MNRSHSMSQPTSVTVALVGDSTVTDRNGWGKGFAARARTNVTVRNFAAGGRSSKSWYDEGRLPSVLAAQPDYVLVQFGHNDQPGKGPDRETDPATSYRDYLKIYVSACRGIRATPIIISPVTRRTFGECGRIRSTLAPWADGARAVAEASRAPFVDLHALSVQYHNTVGAETSAAFNPKGGDSTHFNQKGADAIADLIVEELSAIVPDLAACFR
jgi:pectinesterase